MGMSVEEYDAYKAEVRRATRTSKARSARAASRPEAREPADSADTGPEAPAIGSKTASAAAKRATSKQAGTAAKGRGSKADANTSSSTSSNIYGDGEQELPPLAPKPCRKGAKDTDPPSTIDALSPRGVLDDAGSASGEGGVQARSAAHKAAIADAIRRKWQDPEYRAKALAGGVPASVRALCRCALMLLVPSKASIAFTMVPEPIR